MIGKVYIDGYYTNGPETKYKTTESRGVFRGIILSKNINDDKIKRDDNSLSIGMKVTEKISIFAGYRQSITKHGYTTTGNYQITDPYKWAT